MKFDNDAYERGLKESWENRKKYTLQEYVNWRVSYFSGEKRKEQRLGQCWINEMTTNIRCPELFYQTNSVTAEKFIFENFIIS